MNNRNSSINNNNNNNNNNDNDEEIEMKQLNLAEVNSKMIPMILKIVYILIQDHVLFV